MRILTTILLLTLPLAAAAEIKEYKSTDNTGLNKAERIETVEGYLSDLSKSLKKMEDKLDENSRKLSALDGVVKAMAAEKEAADKLLKEKLGEKKSAGGKDKTEEASELEKLRGDIMALKNDDIEKLKIDFGELLDSVRALQATMKYQLEATDPIKSKKK